MNLALIGCGKIATNHIRAALSNSIDIIALCDIVPAGMESLLNKCGIPYSDRVKRYTDYRDMICDNSIDIDVAAITTDSGSHAEIALFCIDKGINIIIEKPMAMSIEDADRIISLSEQRGVKVAVCHPNRYNASVRKVRTALESGRFGKISHGTVHIRWNRGKSYYEQAGWRGRWANDGGALMNQCIHGIDMLRWMMNDEITEVYGVTRQRFHDYIEAEDLGLAIVKFNNGSVATIEGTINVYPQNLEETLYLFGERGTVKLGGKSMDTIELWSIANEVDSGTASAENTPEDTAEEHVSGHAGIYADMVDAIMNNRKPYIDAREGKAAVELVLAIYKSQKEGRAVKLPLEGFSSIDMRGEFDNG